MPDVSIICCYNSERILDSMLVNSIREQIGVAVETIFLKGEFNSAAASFNHAITKAQSDHLVFIHQDLMLTQPDFLRHLIEEIDKEKNALYGLCGTIYNETETRSYTFSNVFHGLWNRNVGMPISRKTRVSGLDEIFVAFHKDLTRQIQFDAVNLNGWHLYIEDLCLSAELQGIPVFVLPLSSQHKGVLEMPSYMGKYGILPKEFFLQLRQLRQKYKTRVNRISCPCVTISTSPLLFWWDYYRLYLRHRRKKFFRDLSFI